jgi:hypothetical protein
VSLPIPLTPGQVAGLYGVDSKTVTRWAKAGKLDCIRTPGGQRRYPVAVVAAKLDWTSAQVVAGSARRFPVSGGGCNHVWFLVRSQLLSNGDVVEHWECHNCPKTYRETVKKRAR